MINGEPVVCIFYVSATAGAYFPELIMILDDICELKSKITY